MRIAREDGGPDPTLMKKVKSAWSEVRRGVDRDAPPLVVVGHEVLDMGTGLR